MWAFLFGWGLQRNGVLCAAIDYRNWPQASIPEMVADVERALRWVQAHSAEVGGDMHGRVSIVGQSAGAHLTALLLLRVRAPNAHHQRDRYSAHHIARRIPICSQGSATGIGRTELDMQSNLGAPHQLAGGWRLPLQLAAAPRLFQARHAHPSHAHPGLWRVLFCGLAGSASRDSFRLGRGACDAVHFRRLWHDRPQSPTRHVSPPASPPAQPHSKSTKFFGPGPCTAPLLNPSRYPRTLPHPPRFQLVLEPEEAMPNGQSLLAKITRWVGVSGPYDLHACARELDWCASGEGG